MNRGHKVKPLSTAIIRKTAQGIKDLVQVKDQYFPIVTLIELMQEKGVIEFEICEKEEMPNDYGLSFPQKNKIVLREDVYDKAVEGDGFGRFTLAHELGHLILHKQEAVYARNEHGGNHKVFEDSEWQADKFAQELLVDERQVEPGYSISDIENKFGVSQKAARVTHHALNKK